MRSEVIKKNEICAILEVVLQLFIQIHKSLTVVNDYRLIIMKKIRFKRIRLNL